jgi:L-2,4-diaminobutyric acid acetyltransferase
LHPTNPEPIPVRLRPPQVEDAAAIWRLLTEIGDLERNSAYAYLLLCSHFADTGVVAVTDRGDIVGFVLGYRPPTRPDSVFVWQVGVAPPGRGQGLAGRMLDHLLARPGCADARYLSATVEPDNAASLALFHGFARRRGVACTTTSGFTQVLFPEQHADENLLRIGPLTGARDDHKE